MPKEPIQAILCEVEKPSRYLGTEINRIVKRLDDVTLRMVLAFPDLYEIGTSHFGIQILYHLLNGSEDIAVERVYAPGKDMEDALRRHSQPLVSLESQMPLRRFHIVGFSLLYELNFTNVLNMLDLSGIPLYAEQRRDNDPIVIGGGPCVSNPEPMAPFFDAMVFGDGEDILPEMARLWMAWKKSGDRRREVLLEKWSGLDGVYIPGFFKAVYDADGFQQLVASNPEQRRVRRAIVSDLDRSFFPDRPIVAFGRPVHDRMRLEISRGCSRGCRFCQAGMIYRPVRERSMQTLLNISESALGATGYEELSLLSLSTGDYSCLAPLIESLMQRCGRRRVAVSLPSMRAGTLTPGLMKQIKKVRKTGFTIAPEAGSQRLRDVINKNLTFDDIAATVTDAFNLGWQVIKLYFMIGLPTETEDDLNAIVQMVGELKKIKSPVGRRGKINVSVATFVPKAHTPFQWAEQIGMDESWHRIEYLRKQLRIPGVQVKWQHPAMSLLEGVLARGDRRVAAVIERAWRSGCTFDGWSDQFSFEQWRRAFAECGVSMGFFTSRVRTLDEVLPWAHMDSRIDDDFLKAEWRAARQGSVLDDCRLGQCHRCGVCDFEKVAPRRFVPEAVSSVQVNDSPVPAEKYRKIRLLYSKRAQARFFGHLEVASLFARALRRGGIDVLYSNGYHPMPRISFDDPLPLGMESEGERMWIRVPPKIRCRDVVEALRGKMPHGIEIVDCREAGARDAEPVIEDDRYLIELPAGVETCKVIARFRQQENFTFKRDRKGSTKTTDLKACVNRLERRDDGIVELAIRKNTALTVRPRDILSTVFQMDPKDILCSVRVIKLAPGNPFN